MGGGAPHPVLNNYYYYKGWPLGTSSAIPTKRKNAKSLRGKGGPHGTAFWNELSFAGSAENEGAPPVTGHKPIPKSRCLVSTFVHYSVILLQELDRCVPTLSHGRPRGKGGPHGTAFWNELSFAGSAENEGAPPVTGHKPIPKSRCLVSTFVHYSVILLQELDRCVPTLSHGRPRRFGRRCYGSVASFQQGCSGRLSRRPSRNIAPVQQSVAAPPARSRLVRASHSWLASDLRSDRCPNRAQRRSRNSCRKLHFDGRWFLQSTVQIMLCKYSKKAHAHVGPPSESLIARTKVRSTRHLF